jgi:hypothetical protein
LFSRRDPQRIEPPRQRGDRLVGREDPLPLGNQRKRDALQVVARHADPPCIVPIEIRKTEMGRSLFNHHGKEFFKKGSNKSRLQQGYKAPYGKGPDL